MLETQLKLQEHVFSRGMDYFNAMLSDIQQACATIDLETYIFANDVIGDKFVESLIAAANRGVRVRIIVDGFGSPTWQSKYKNKLEINGVHSKIYHPLPWRPRQLSSATSTKQGISKWIYLLFNFNKRDHRKFMLVDDKIAYVGSFNISRSHIAKAIGGRGWRDLGVKVTGADTEELKNAFDYCYYHRPIKERIREIFLKIKNKSPFRLNYSIQRRRILYKDFIKKINRAKEKIWLTNAYFVPQNRLIRQLRAAAERGVDVKILLPNKSDVFIMPWASHAFYNKLLNGGVTIYEFLPEVLHAKAVIIDNWCQVGSSNLNHRSLLHDLEVDVVLHTKSAKDKLMDLFKNDIRHARQITKAKWTKRPFYQRFLGRIVLYVKYIF
jgi:cardiolipin synthase